MNVIHKTQLWKGEFTYLKGYAEKEIYRSVKFTLEINVSNSTFTGISWDEESKHYFKSPANVKGFFDEEKVSFVLKYPCYYYKNEKGKIELDYNQEHPDIHYFGEFDNKDKSKVTGEWEMAVYVEETIDGYFEEFCSGSFEMHKTY
jgi:hypothetical protein